MCMLIGRSVIGRSTLSRRSCEVLKGETLHESPITERSEYSGIDTFGTLASGSYCYSHCSRYPRLAEASH